MHAVNQGHKHIVEILVQLMDKDDINIVIEVCFD